MAAKSSTAKLAFRNGAMKVRSSRWSSVRPRPRPRNAAADQGRGRLRSKAGLQLEWTRGIHDEQWEVYSIAIQTLRKAGVRFLLGGGFALAAYIGRWRNTKDIDFYIFP